MIIQSFDTDKDILVIAEIGNNHEGKFEVAEKLIHEAALAGAGAVKFQTYRTELYVSKKETARFNRLKSFELKPEEFDRLSRIAKDMGLLFISTPFDLESAKFLNGIVSAFKIASGDNNFFSLIETVAGFGKPTILSTGLASMEEVKHAKGLIENIWKKKKASQACLGVLHCVTAYPVPPEEANIGLISRFRKELDCTIGYSDHTLGTQACVLATALGARIIEKHFTLDKKFSDFRDHQISADPAELKELIARIKEVQSYLGNGRKELQKSERQVMESVRRSIVAKRDLPAGTVISAEDFTWLRPGGGLPPGKELLILGKKLVKGLSEGDQIVLDNLEES
jgi:N,N'-diacetyllegionaminate synthase